MSDISQEYPDDEDITPFDDSMHDSDGFAAQSQEEYDDCTREFEGPIDTNGPGDGYHMRVRSLFLLIFT
jgi:hypothetical protein